jgi:hypothetical protein
MKTITLCDKQDNPTYSLCRGHVTATVFNKAHRAEGWKGDWVHKNMLTHEYWKPGKPGKAWKQSKEPKKGFRKFTAMGW